MTEIGYWTATTTSLVADFVERHVEAAADAWAEAAGAHGAYAPPHIARALLDSEADLLGAAIAGTRTALDQHESEGYGGPQPRGCTAVLEHGELEVQGGEIVSGHWQGRMAATVVAGTVTLRAEHCRAIEWRSQTTCVSLSRTTGVVAWRVEIRRVDGGEILRSARAWAALLDTHNVELEFLFDGADTALPVERTANTGHRIEASVAGIPLHRLEGQGAIRVLA